MQGLLLSYKQVATSDREQETLYLKEHNIHYQAGYLCSSHWDLLAPHHQSPESPLQAPAAEVLQGAAAEVLLSVDELAWTNMISLE